MKKISNIVNNLQVSPIRGIFRGGFLALALALAGCVSEDFSGDSELASGQESSIAFNAGSSATTRSTLSGSAAAEKLNKHFVVYATKHSAVEDKTATNDALVFNQYNVVWDDSNINKTKTNEYGWEYLGKQSYSSATTSQNTKYWDYDATKGYTFYAFSSSNISYPANNSKDSIQITKLTTGTNVYDKGYAVTIKNGARLGDLYFSDRIPVAKTDYSKPVDFNFHPFGAKVRVGFYENIPGYTVKITKFYYDKDATAPVTAFDNMIDVQTKNCIMAYQDVKNTSSINCNILYRNSGDTQNQPYSKYTSASFNYYTSFGGRSEEWKNITIGTSSATATYANEDGSYVNVYPFEAATQPLLLKCDYTITSEEDKEETLTITGAKAIVPLEYLNWKSGHSYTYLFKISSESSGTTGTSGTDPEGLYSISFDGVAVSTDDNDQTTLTSIDQFNITTYRPDGNVYVINSDNNTGNVIIPTGIGDTDGKAQLYYVTTTKDEIDEVTVNARLTGVNNGLTLEPVKITEGAQAGMFAAELVYQVPALDGGYYTFGTEANPGALKFTPEVGHAYAYVYCSKRHTSPTYTQCTSSSTYDSATQYYTYSSGSYYAATPTQAEFNANKTSYYIQTSAGTTGTYAVMVLDTRES